jgi:LmbE family N-acetylglucosaminyl deacetylase
MNTKESILIFGAHPDDIEIGMGGTVAKLSKSDDYDVHLVIATLPNFVKSDTKEGRQSEAIMSAKVMGCSSPELLDLSPEELVFNRRFVGIVDKIIREKKPDAVFTQWIGDSHQDHQSLTRAVIAACRDLNNIYPGRYYRMRISTTALYRYCYNDRDKERGFELLRFTKNPMRTVLDRRYYR